MSRPKVLVVSARFAPEIGGIETHVDEVCRRLADSGEFEMTVLTTDRSRRLPAREWRGSLEVLRVPAWPRERDYYLAPGLVPVVRDPRWDVVHLQGIHTAVPVIAGLAAARAAHPYVLSFHTGGHSLRHRNAARAAQWRVLHPLLSHASALVAVSDTEADFVSRSAGIDRELVRVIRNGGTLPPSSPSASLVPGRILSVGRLERYKGHHRVIEALPHVRDRVPEAHLVIVGQGPYEEELRRSAAALGVADRIEIIAVPPTDRQQMADVLAGAAVVATFSEYEAHPVAVMEALGAGRPVVALDVAGTGELVRQGLVRGLPAASTSGELGRALADVIRTPPAPVPVRIPTWDDCAAQLVAVYAEVLGHSGAVSHGSWKGRL